MREILFRGKRVDNGMWIEGCLRQYPSGAAGICDKEMQHTFHVDPETVGQYTGLDDKNGKKIFEGDIVAAVLPESDSQRRFEWPLMYVEFFRGAFCLLCASGHMFATLGGFGPTVTLEVKGNIHDNPELLGGEANG